MLGWFLVVFKGVLGFKWLLMVLEAFFLNYPGPLYAPKEQLLVSLFCILKKLLKLPKKINVFKSIK